MPALLTVRHGAALMLAEDVGPDQGGGNPPTNRASRRHPDQDLITVPMAARRIGLHPDTLYRLCRNGEFPPAVHIGSRWKVSVPGSKGTCMGVTHDPRTRRRQGAHPVDRPTA